MDRAARGEGVGRLPSRRGGRASSRLGLSYERGPPPFRASVFGGATLEASLRELEVWVAADGGKKRAPFRTSRI